jgi:hypothetical protein
MQHQGEIKESFKETTQGKRRAAFRGAVLLNWRMDD